MLRIINRFNIGGPTYNATFLTRFLPDDYETMLVGGLPEEGESDSLYILDQYGVKPVLVEEIVRNPKLSSDRKAYKKLKSIIKEFKPDIVHTHAAKAGALGRRAAKACNVPVIVHTFHGHVFHSYFNKAKTSVFKAIERNLAKKSDAIVAISNIQKDELTEVHKVAKPSKVTVVPLGFDLELFHKKAIDNRKIERETKGLEEKTVAIAIIGRFAPIKDHGFFFDVVENVLSRINTKVKFYVVGDGTERDFIEERANSINKQFPGVIELTSWVRDIALFNAAMDVICLTSKNEGTPVSLIEAQAANIPVVTTDVGGVRDIVKDGETGFIIPPNELNMFSNRLIELIEDKKKRDFMSQNGWNHVREKFHYTTLVQNMDRLYKRKLKEKGYEIV